MQLSFHFPGDHVWSDRMSPDPWDTLDDAGRGEVVDALAKLMAKTPSGEETDDERW